MEKVYKINCEWDMPTASGTYTTRAFAQQAINNEDWEGVGYTLEEVQESGLVSIEEIALNV